MYLDLNIENIDTEHICCAFSDKKCAEGYQLKKEWLKQEIPNGYTFKKLNERAKVFIEYGPAENAWLPITAEGYLNIGCFWVSGKYKKNGHGKNLLQKAIDSAKAQNKNGLVSVVGKKKFHFMSDTKWLLQQGFEVVDELSTGFYLLARNFKQSQQPYFNQSTRHDMIPNSKGCVVYYSNRCPFSEYHVKNSLVTSCRKRNIPLKIIKIDNIEQAQKAPTPATIFSLFYKGKFITTDIGTCMDTRFDKLNLHV